MPFQFTHPAWLPALVIALGWVTWLAWRSDASLFGWRRWGALALRVVIVLAVGLALAGIQYRMPVEGMNVFFLLDRSDSVPVEHQESAREFVNTTAAAKPAMDRGGVVVFGADAAIEASPSTVVNLPRVQAVISSAASDLASAVRLATAAFPENGQKRLVLATDGNQTAGDVLQAVVAARTLGVTVDVVPLGTERGRDVVLQKVTVPNKLKKGQTFDLKIFLQSDRATTANLSLYRDETLLGTRPVELQSGKNLFTFPQSLTEPGFHSYDVRIDAPGDTVPQNNRASTYTTLRGEPRILLISSDPAADRPLADALAASKLEVRMGDIAAYPSSVAEMQSYDAILLSNIAAGDLSTELMRLTESAVRDFGVGLVVIGGDQSFGAGGYRGTPLEEALPVEMELSSKKVLPRGALVLVVHATEFPNGNQWARDIAFAALQALGPQDEMGIVLWDGVDRWLFELSQVGDKKAKGRAITGMNPGDMGDFGGPMRMAHAALKKTTANLKHMVVFSDGDPHAASDSDLKAMVSDRITISTVMVGGHVEPSTMVDMAAKGRGRFYDVRSPAQLPQIFLKEAAVILKAAIIEEPFKPQLTAASEITRGIGGPDFPVLKGYVATTAKSRAEVGLASDKGDPILAQWQFGLGRAVAFTSDARAKWAADWVGWGRYRQFWSQAAQWALRKVDAADFNSEVTLEGGVGRLNVEALTPEGDFRNFLNLQAMVVDPKGRRQTVALEQKGPGRYEAVFEGKEVGAYMVNLLDVTNGTVRAQQALGASLNYSPEFSAAEPNRALLQRVAEAGGGRVLDPAVASDNPFLHDRQRTYQPRDLWWWLLVAAVLLFPIDVGIRRIQWEPQSWRRNRRSVETGGGRHTAPAVGVGLSGGGTQPNPKNPADNSAAGASDSPPVPESATQRLLEAKRRARKKL